MNLEQWRALLHATHVITDAKAGFKLPTDFTLADADTCFMLSRMFVLDEVGGGSTTPVTLPTDPLHTPVSYTHLTLPTILLV
eukprot:1187384-Prorocentrum_minimum.AAC.1